MLRNFGLLVMLMLVSACGSRYPTQIDQAVSSEATVSDIQQGLATDKGVTVRWGGVIANINNQEKQTWLEVVQLPIKSNGKPRDTDVSSGRFLVKIEGFLDPAIYAKGREFTVVGILSGMSDGKIGEFEYKFPVVAAQGYHLWPQTRELDYYNAYFIPVTYWRPYLPYYYPIHYRPRIIRPRAVQPNPTVNPPPRAPRTSPPRPPQSTRKMEDRRPSNVELK